MGLIVIGKMPLTNVTNNNKTVKEICLYVVCLTIVIKMWDNFTNEYFSTRKIKTEPKWKYRTEKD